MKMTTCLPAASTYQHHPHWRRYQPFLAPSWRLDADRTPREAAWSFGPYQVHLDMLDAPDARATVVLLHGGGGNGRVVMFAAPLLRELGCSVVAPDLPGYGLTRASGAAAPPTYNLWADLAACLIDELTAQRHQPVLAFGLSLGGLLAYGAAARSQTAAGVIATTLADTRQPDVLEAISSLPIPGAISAACLRAMPSMLHRLRLPIRWLCPMHLITNDPAFSRVFATDPLAGGSRISLGFLRSLALFQVGVEPEQFDRCPLLCVHPGLDPWTPSALSRAFFDRLRGPKQWVDLEGCGHLPYEEPGASQLAKAIAAFVDDVVASRA